MGSTNVKIILASYSIAWAVAGFNIAAIYFTGSANGMDDSLSRAALLMWGSSYILAMMANNVQRSQIGGMCLKKMNRKTSVETCVFLGLHPHILFLSTHQSALILRISITHTHTYLFFADRPCTLIHPSINVPLASIGAFSHTIPFYLT
jgi:hypothetical protein